MTDPGYGRSSTGSPGKTEREQAVPDVSRVTAPTRLRRLRRTANLRALVRESQLSTDDLVLPLFEIGRVSVKYQSRPEILPQLPARKRSRSHI
jgi:delta-aminolevulinic acid dehydratase/porphobilinogen synthase